MSKRHRRQNKPRVVVAQPVAGSEAQKREPMKISDTALAYARRKGGGRTEILSHTFAFPSFPPGVKPGPKMAMDDASPGLGEVMQWASAQAAILSEGLTFMGFAYLSELMQRPEYRVIAETLAGEMTRKWIRLTSTSTEDKAKEERIKELEAEMNRLNVRDRFKRCAELDGGFGRAHLYADTGDTDKTEELTTDIGDGWNDVSAAKISPKHPIRQFKVIEPVWVYPQSYNSTNPLADDWYKPQQWMVQGMLVHCTRLLTFVGREVPDLIKPTYAFGGLSMVQMAKPYVDNWLKTRQGVQDIITSFNVFALMTNLGETLQADGDQLFKRAEIFNRYRDNQGLMLLDKDSEDFKNISAPLGGLHELQGQAQEHLCSVSRTPGVKLLGIQPAGMNSTSEGELRSYYDYVKSWQEHLFRHKLKTVIGFTMLSLWGEVDPDIDFEFIDLWALDEKGQAELEKAKMETDQGYVDMGALHPEEVRKRVAAEPDSGYASIDVDDVPDLSLEESEGLEPVGGRPDPEAVLSGEEEEGGEPPPDDGTPPGKRKPKPQAKPAQDAVWVESNHERDDYGRFGEGGAGGSKIGKESPTILFHGSKSAISGQFKVSRGMNGVYLTSSRGSAAHYAKTAKGTGAPVVHHAVVDGKIGARGEWEAVGARIGSSEPPFNPNSRIWAAMREEGFTAFWETPDTVVVPDPKDVRIVNSETVDGPKPAQDETVTSPMAMDASPLWEGETVFLSPGPPGKRAARRRRGKARRLSIIVSGAALDEAID